MPAPKLLWINPLQNSTPDGNQIDEFVDIETIHMPSIKDVGSTLIAEPVDCVLISGRAENRAELLEVIHSMDRDVPVVFWDSDMSAGEASKLVREGAFECHGYRDGIEQVHSSVRRALEYTRQCRRRRGQTGAEPWRKILVGDSKAMETVAATVRLVGPRRCTVLITGESGTGKEVAARAIHMASPRAHHPMVAVNCAALPENLLEAELFGHVRGAFTGAANMRIGRFEQANKSTIFLDEVGEMPMELQAKLLRVLQEREIQRLGSSDTIKVDVRVIAASNANLLERVRQGQFREDLYYRLNVVPLHMPALRQRPEDIPQLVHHFVAKICSAEGIALKQVSPTTIERLKSQPWPGNVRQLENAVEAATVFNGDREMLTIQDFGLPEYAPAKLIPFDFAAERPSDGLESFASAVNRFERGMIEKALAKTQGNRTAAAELLGLKRTTLIMKLRSFEGAAVLRAV